MEGFPAPSNPTGRSIHYFFASHHVVADVGDAEPDPEPEAEPEANMQVESPVQSPPQQASALSSGPSSSSTGSTSVPEFEVPNFYFWDDSDMWVFLLDGSNQHQSREKKKKDKKVKKDKKHKSEKAKEEKSSRKGLANDL